MKKVFLLLLSVFLLGACSSKKSDGRDEELIVGYKLIDSGDHESAISHFLVLNERDPKNQDYIRGLGSAYAANAGFGIGVLAQNLSAFREIDDNKKKIKEFFSKFEGNSTVQSMNHFLTAQLEISFFLAQVRTVPSLKSDQKINLELAIGTYLQLEKPNQADFLMLAIFETIIMKEMVARPMPIRTCAEVGEVIQSRFSRLAQKYSRILSYMIIAQPTRKDSFQKQRVQLEKSFLEVDRLTSDATVAVSIIDALNANKDFQIFGPKINCRLDN